jgi:glutamate-ammonia-ligase adenylyltransferase
MTLENRITKSPIAYEPRQGTEAAKLAPWAGPALAEVLKGMVGCSAYLRGLLGRESVWLQEAQQDPEQAMLTAVSWDTTKGLSELGRELRQSKRRVALLAAVCDLGGVWDLDGVTGALTDLADAAVRVAFKVAVQDQIRQRRLPVEATDGLVVFAMGKMGARELNYSSDIDLICLFDETRFPKENFSDVRSGYIRATRAAVACLNDVTSEGYVFRTDLRLRPDPSVTPVCLGMEAAERYYESLGRTWERAAWIKARVAAGDEAAGQRFQEALRPFIWRRHLDFAAIEDAHNMRLAIRQHKGTGGLMRLERHNMKLGQGGIREIEFFTQTRQLISGGRDSDLRHRATRPALQALAQKGWIETPLADALCDHYVEHRTTEHRLQMLGDAQTHDLPATQVGFDRLAAFMGTTSDRLRKTLTERLTQVHTLTEDFFAPGAAPTGTQDQEDHDLTKRWLSYPALRSSRAVEIFKRLRPDILRRLHRAARPDEAIAAFDGFLSGLPAGVQLFSLFEANRQLVDLLVDIVAVSPELARYLSRNAAVFDAVIGGDFFSDWPDLEPLKVLLAERLAAEPDYEAKLSVARIWKREWHFRVGVHLLRGLSTPDAARRQYCDVAEAVVSALWPEVQAQFAVRHGLPPGRGAVVVGMGSLGAGALHALSDLDVIVIYDSDGTETSEGLRPLPARTYYARLTQALITALSAPMADGRLYDVDMRLRPSGNQGPVATSLASFSTYQRDKAWVWEHLALTRARVVAGSVPLAKDVEDVRRDILALPRDQRAVLSEVASMRARIATSKAPFGPLDPKIGPGRLQDIELLAQAGTLLSGFATHGIAAGLTAAADRGWLSVCDAEHLTKAHAVWSSVQVALRLIGDGDIQANTLSTAARAFLCRVFDLRAVETLESSLCDEAQTSASIIDTALPVPDSQGNGKGS